MKKKDGAACPAPSYAFYGLIQLTLNFGFPVSKKLLI